MNRAPLYVSEHTIGVTLIIIFFLVIFYRPLLTVWDDFTTPQPWFTASLSIPDHSSQKNPKISYGFKAKRPLNGHWMVNIYRYKAVGRKTYSCSGTGASFYDEGEYTTNNITLYEFIGKECALPIGSYEACALYNLADNHANKRKFGPYCTSFSVYSPETIKNSFHE